MDVLFRIGVESRVVGGEGDGDCDDTTDDGKDTEEMTDVGLLFISSGLGSVFDPTPVVAVDCVVVDFDVVAVPLFLRRPCVFVVFVSVVFVVVRPV